MTPEQGKELYYLYKSRYETAVINKRKAEAEMERNTLQKNRAIEIKNSDVFQKSNLEERLGQVKDIITKLTEIIPEKIIASNNIAQKAGDCYLSTITCNDIVLSNIGVVFKTKSIEEDNNSSLALIECKTEQKRIEGEILQLTEEIKRLNSAIDQYNSNIRNCKTIYEQSQSNLRRYSNYTEYKKYLYI